MHHLRNFIFKRNKLHNQLLWQIRPKCIRGRLITIHTVSILHFTHFDFFVCCVLRGETKRKLFAIRSSSALCLCFVEHVEF